MPKRCHFISTCDKNKVGVSRIASMQILVVIGYLDMFVQNKESNKAAQE